MKFVAKRYEKFLSYEEKRSYLRILRAQLFNEEQALLFYNSKSTLGVNWENDKNKFLTNYRMIHNLHNNILIEDFNLTEEFGLDESPEYRKEKNRDDDFLFEFEENRMKSNQK